MPDVTTNYLTTQIQCPIIMCSVTRVSVDDKFSQNSILIPQPQTIKINIWTHNGKCKDHLILAHIQ